MVIDGQHNRIHVNGVSLGVEQRGDAGQPPLVLLHGFTGSTASWHAHLDTFAASGVRVIAFDMLGHGRSDAPEDSRRYSIEHCSDDIVAALRQLGVREREAILLGYSMGGRIALYTAFSGFFRALILESASPGIEDSEERYRRQSGDAALAARIEDEGIPAFVDYWERLPLFESQRRLPSEVFERQRAQRLLNSGTGLANSLRGVGTGAQPSLHARLPTLPLPVLLIVGELDKKYCTLGRAMASSLPHAQLAVVADAGHSVHLEQPERFDALVLDFCQSIGARSIRPYKYNF